MHDHSTRDPYRSILGQFKPNDGDLLGALHAVQEEFGWITHEGVDAVAHQLRLNASLVFGVATFYAEFRTSPPAHLTVDWCSGPACRLKGGDNIRRVLETTFGFGMENSSPDGRLGLHVQQCDGSCALAPLVWLKRESNHPEGPFAPLQRHRGQVIGPLTLPDAIAFGRKLMAGEEI